MAYTGQKVEFIGRLVALSGLLASMKSQADTIYADYFDRTYGSSGDDEIVAEDLTGTAYDGLSVETITAGITALENLIKYFDNQAVAQGDYASTYSKLKK
jgi:hypothetical protein